MDASRAVFNYAYWMITHKKWQPELLVLDEAHNVSDVILEHVGTSINEHQRTTWGLPPFPLIESTTTSGLLRAQDYIAPDEAAAMWLNDAAGIMNQKVNTLRRVIEHGAHVTTKLLYQKRAAENLAHKLDTCLGAVEANPGDHWYIRSGPGVEYYQGQLVPGFLCKPLTARFDFPEFFATSPVRQVLIMSATIGQPETFAAELGLTDYTFYRTPAVWPPETRPVHILDVPSMGYAATKKDPTIFDKQADAIAKAIKQLPDTWSGIILVSRKSEATLLANRLRARGLANRMWVPPGAENGEYKPTNEQIMAWEEQLRYRPNTIAVAWSFWEGVDAKDSQILIAAKVPFHPRSSEFEMAREQYDHSFASQRVAWLLEQGLGRVRRGDPSDYNDPKQGIVRTYVAIADGSWTRIRKYLSQSMLDSLVIN
jgi:Rad3-related DNA helicase